MGHIPKKTLIDLEYQEVLRQCANFAITPLGKSAIRALEPEIGIDLILKDLQAVSEFRASFENENRIPNHGFESMSEAFSLLKIENSVLDVETFRTLAVNTETTNLLLKFLKQFKTYYPQLFEGTSGLTEEKEIKKQVDAVIDRFGEMRNNASETLYSIRKKIQQVRGKISSSFNKALSQFQGADYLDDIRESIIDNRRVLAVKAMYRRKIKGTIMGSSKTGSIVFIEPEATHVQTQELQNLIFEEGEEIKKILSQLTDFFRPFLRYFQAQQDFLLRMDVVYAKARYAQEINGILPDIATEERKLDYKKAYHPLLLSIGREGNPSPRFVFGF